MSHAQRESQPERGGWPVLGRRSLLVGLGGLLGSIALSAAGPLGRALASAGAPVAGRVLPRSHGLAIDHIALGVPDMPKALLQIAADTGAEPYTTDPEPGHWYWSGALALGDDSFLEILGPNPAHEGFHPLKQLISGYEKPRLLFWYVATDDFDRFQARAEASGAPLERVETIDFTEDGRPVHYKRGIVGPGFVTQRPCVIEWRVREERVDADQRCHLRAFRLRHPEAAEMNRVFGELGIEQVVEEGPSWIAIDLDTPNGVVTYENEGESLVGFSSMLQIGRLYLRHLGI